MAAADPPNKPRSDVPDPRGRRTQPPSFLGSRQHAARRHVVRRSDEIARARRRGAGSRHQRSWSSTFDQERACHADSADTKPVMRNLKGAGPTAMCPKEARRGPSNHRAVGMYPNASTFVLPRRVWRSNGAGAISDLDLDHAPFCGRLLAESMNQGPPHGEPRQGEAVIWPRDTTEIPNAKSRRPGSSSLVLRPPALLPSLQIALLGGPARPFLAAVTFFF